MTIEKTLFAAADKMRGSMDPGEYKHVALGLLFLRYIGVAFQRIGSCKGGAGRRNG